MDGLVILLEGLTVHVDQAGGGAQTTFYNALGHPYVSQQRSSSTLTKSTVETRYTGVFDGQVASVTRPFLPSIAVEVPRERITFHYDALGRLKDQKLPNGSITTYAYNGLHQSVTDPKGNQSETVLDDLGRVASISETIEATTRSPPRTLQAVQTDYVHGPFSEVEQVKISGVLASLIGPPAITLLRTTQMTYDTLGRRKHLDDPDSGVSERTYNAFGEVAQEQLGDPLKMPGSEIERIVYVRDQIGRVVSEAPSSQGPNTFQWDTAPFGVGRLASSLSADGIAHAYSYDSNGRLLQERSTIDDPTPYVMDYSYDAFGRVKAIRYPTVPGRANRFAVSYHYDPIGIADAVCNADGSPSQPSTDCDPNVTLPLWRANFRQPDGQLTNETFANGEVTEREYFDPRGFLTKIETKLGATKNQSLGYTYDANGNLQSRAESISLNGSQTFTNEAFTYDALNRLRSGLGVRRWLRSRRSVLSRRQGAWAALVRFGNCPRGSAARRRFAGECAAEVV